MDDRDLEARLRTHLHERFDAVPAPAGLASAVGQAMTTDARRVGFLFRPGSLQVGWAATLGILVVIGAFLLFGRIPGPGSPGASGTPSPAAPTEGAERAFVVLPKGGSTPAKADSLQAADVFEARLRALGLESFWTASGFGFELYAPADGPSDEDIRAVLAATGEVEFVPLPPETLGNVDATTLVGKPLPVEVPVLFDRAGIASAKRGTSSQGLATVDLVLTPSAAALFADHTTTNVGEYFAIVIDGTVALVPVISEPIPTGQVSISVAATSPGPDALSDAAAAILIGGRLPDAWRGADVPRLITREDAIVAARTSVGDTAGVADLVSADLDVNPGDTGWQPIWVVVLENIPGKDSTSTMQVIMDATGK